MVDLNKFNWIFNPKIYKIENGSLEIVTSPNTDLWQRTYYHFRNDNAPMLVCKTNEKYFSFVVKTNFVDAHTRFDQCGIIVYQDSESWIKASVEYENSEFGHLGSVVTNNGYSDWATTEIGVDVKEMYYRLSRRENDFCIESSFDGVKYSQMRVCHLFNANDEIRFGVYACSPENSSFKAKFSNFDITECMWKSHDGQKPDE